MKLKQPLIIPVSNRLYELAVSYTYEWELEGYPRQRLRVPKGFQFDGASVPRPLWSITGIRPDGLHRAAALVHDYLYEYEGKLPPGSHTYLDTDGEWKSIDYRWTRKEADRIFCRLLSEGEVGGLKRRLMYYSVRLFGWLFW